MDFSILKASGITQAEFGAFLQVSRVSVSSWVNGHPIHKLRRPKVERLLQAVALAVELKMLPLPAARDTDEKSRNEELKKVLMKSLNKVANQ